MTTRPIADGQAARSLSWKTDGKERKCGCGNVACNIGPFYERSELAALSLEAKMRFTDHGSRCLLCGAPRDYRFNGVLTDVCWGCYQRTAEQIGRERQAAPAAPAVLTLKRLAEGRRDMNRRTAEIHPDPVTREAARVRADAYEMSVWDCDAVLKTLAAADSSR